MGQVVIAGDWGSKKTNTGSTKERAENILSRRKPTTSLAISAIIYDNKGEKHKFSELLVDENQLFFAAKHSASWCNLELANLEEIRVVNLKSSDGEPILIEDKDSGHAPLLKISVKEKNTKKPVLYLTQPDILFSGVKKSGIRACLPLRDISVLKIISVEVNKDGLKKLKPESKAAKELQKTKDKSSKEKSTPKKKLAKGSLEAKLYKKFDAFDKKEEMEDEEQEPSFIMRLFGYGKRNKPTLAQEHSLYQGIDTKDASDADDTAEVCRADVSQDYAAPKSKLYPADKLPGTFLTFEDLDEICQRDGECNICLESFFETKDTLQKRHLVCTPCEHYFHKICLQRWLAKSDHAACPTCRNYFAQ